jgi:hypothetical protein
MTTFAPLSNEDVLIFLCSSENSPIICKNIMANLTEGRKSLNSTTASMPAALTTPMASSTSSSSNGILHEILPYLTVFLIILGIYVISVCFLRFAAKLSWLNAISLALGLVFHGKEAICCILNQSTYAAGADTGVIPVTSDLGSMSRRGAVRLTNLNVQESSV